MNVIYKISIILVISFSFWALAEDSSGNFSLIEEKSDSIKVTVNQKEVKKKADIKGTTNIPENKTNWSKIKDLFM